MNDLEQQHIWQTLAAAFMYNFIHSDFTNLSSIYIFLSQDRWLSFEESCRSNCHAVSLRLNEADIKKLSVCVRAAQMSHV